MAVSRRSRLPLLFALWSTPLLLACFEQTPTPIPPGPHEPSGWLMPAGVCKESTVDTEPYDSCVECVGFTYTGDAVLILTHMNAGFNSCPGSITADIRFQDSLIVIEAHERESGCDRLCLYDLHYRIERLRPRVYTLRIVQPYLRQGDEPLEFTLDLRAPVSDHWCVPRSGYPWCLDLYPTGGALVSVSECVVSSDSLWPGWHECMEYAYGEDGTLDLLHVDAVFNCCPGEITGTVTIEPSFEGGTITIDESEKINGCRCICPYTLRYRVEGLPRGIYRILTIEHYASLPHTPRTTLDFTVDLSTPTSGVYCTP